MGKFEGLECGISGKYESHAFTFYSKQVVKAIISCLEIRKSLYLKAYKRMKTIRIGRSHSNDCVFSNLSVSSYHAILTVDADGQHAMLKDLGSTNGTYVNGSNARITSEVRVSRHDPIRFGSETTTLGNILEKANKTIIQPSNSLGGDNAASDRRTIGKLPSNDIVFNHDEVSRRHAVLYKNAAGETVIEDVGSTNGTFVNGMKITSKVLRPGDRVTITRSYPLEWETLLPHSKAPKATNKSTRLIAVAVAAAAILCAAGFFVWQNLKWSSEKIYAEYHSAVCWVYVNFGYSCQIIMDGENIAPAIFKMAGQEYSPIYNIKDGKVTGKWAGSQGTGFFITNDGKIATNLHVACPWKGSDDGEKLEAWLNDLVKTYMKAFPQLIADLSRCEVKVEGVAEGIYVIPDGLPVSDGNLIECDVIKKYDTLEKDVAILQTKARSLPDRVVNIIDIADADLSDEALKVGKKVYTIGFPLGAGIALNSNNELRNQVHGGTITQDRGEYDFGHDAAITHGGSGSPMLNDRGKLVGIANAGVDNTQGFNTAIKAKYIADLLNK